MSPPGFKVCNCFNFFFITFADVYIFSMSMCMRCLQTDDKDITFDIIEFHLVSFHPLSGANDTESSTVYSLV